MEPLKEFFMCQLYRQLEATKVGLHVLIIQVFFNHSFRACFSLFSITQGDPLQTSFATNILVCPCDGESLMSCLKVEICPEQVDLMGLAKIRLV